MTKWSNATKARGGWPATSLTYGLLAGYGALLTTVAFLVVRSGVPWFVAAAAVACALPTLLPVRRWLRGAVDDLLLNHQEDAYEAVTLLHRQLDKEPHQEAGNLLATLIASAVTLPFVEVTTPHGEDQVFGEQVPGTQPVTVPLLYRGESLGHLRVGPRRRGTSLSPADLRLVTDLAGQVATAVFAQRAARDVLESRAQLVTAREEERRRIRRDLHDGLGPTLAALQLQLTAAHRLLPAQPNRAAELVVELLADVRATTGDIRRLVYDLRPPLLDELGVIGAIRNHTTGWTRPTLLIESNDELVGLPAAVEVALYRIAVEALQNVRKHSGASQVVISVDIQGSKVLMSVCDDGRGLPEPLADGVGLMAMRERAAELGGTISVLSTKPAGTTVIAALPLRGTTP